MAFLWLILCGWEGGRVVVVFCRKVGQAQAWFVRLGCAINWLPTCTGFPSGADQLPPEYCGPAGDAVHELLDRGGEWSGCSTARARPPQPAPLPARPLGNRGPLRRN